MGSHCSDGEAANPPHGERGQDSMRLKLGNFLHDDDDAFPTPDEVTADMLVVRVIRNDVEGKVFVFPHLPEGEGAAEMGPPDGSV